MSNCKDKFRMFKGDGDQDRPSIVKEKEDEEPCDCNKQPACEREFS